MWWRSVLGQRCQRCSPDEGTLSGSDVGGSHTVCNQQLANRRNSESYRILIISSYESEKEKNLALLPKQIT